MAIDRGAHMAAINEKSVKAHQAREQAGGRLVDAFLWDDELKGFGCKATAGGKRAFFVQYRPRGGGENIKLGPLDVAIDVIDIAISGEQVGKRNRGDPLYAHAAPYPCGHRS